MTDGSCKPLRYHLRYQIAPGPDVERDAEALKDPAGLPPSFHRQRMVQAAVPYHGYLAVRLAP